MKTRIIPVLIIALSCGITALSTGSEMYLMAAILLTLLLGVSVLSVMMVAGTMRVTHDMSAGPVQRGDHVTLTVSVSHRSILPTAPITLHLSGISNAEQRKIRLKDVSGKVMRIHFPFDAVHIGVINPGIEKYIVEDMFGLITLTRREVVGLAPLLVLPQTFDVETLKFAPGDSGLETMARATEDVNLPADVRTYQKGDPLKKVHWKLSARKGSLMVRRFEEPTYPDALVLMDCAAPPFSDAPDKQAFLKDTILETAASVVQHHIRGDHPVRLPLFGSNPMEFEKSMGMPALMEALARLDFSQTERFERVLLLEMRRMRKTGATVVITARLNSNVVDMIIRIRRMGPYVRLYLVTFTPNDPPLLPLISKLQQNTIEVCYVTPAA